MRTTKGTHGHIYCLTMEHPLRRPCASCGAPIRVDRAVFCSECAAGRDRERTRAAQRRHQAVTTSAALAAWQAAASRVKQPYTHVNSRGQVFYLQARTVTRRDGTRWRAHYFALAPNPEEVVEGLPAGYTIAENPISALPLLKRRT